jgi:phenylalanyl-tRNA synthetase alpha chain
MRVFFKKMGMSGVRFKPAYNPYTEVRLGNLVRETNL